MKFLIVAFVCFLLSLVIIQLMCGCAPMPDNTKLFKQIKEPQNVEDIADFKEHPGGLWETIGKCYVISYPSHPIRNTLALLTFTPVIGCAQIQIRDGKITKCHVYYPKGDEYTRTHELNHCRGYADKLF